MRDSTQQDSPARPAEVAWGVGARPPKGAIPVPDFDERRLQLQFDSLPGVSAQADSRGTRRKMLAGLRGLKQAIRGDSSFYAHAYRGVLIGIIAALLRVSIWGWCLLVLGGSLVLLAELCNSAVDTLARAIGDPEEPRLAIAREMAAAGVLVVAFATGAVTTVVLTTKLIELYGWS